MRAIPIPRAAGSGSLVAQQQLRNNKVAMDAMSAATANYTSFEVEWRSASCSLQDAFREYRRNKQRAMREQLKTRQDEQIEDKPAESSQALRKKFLETAMSYIGVPYAKKYHAPDSPSYHSPLFLDCCGLVRRVLRDLKEDVGFTVGPWNQAYQFDTLPIALAGPEEMQPGDLVFISGIYNNPKVKAQCHNMVHVEIWVGDGEKTLGARWQKGVVQIHDSYKFTAKSYHSMEYHFRSIDTWLAGTCKSFCEQHPWQGRSFNPGKFSIFALDQSCGQEEEDDLQEVQHAPLDVGIVNLPLTSGASKRGTGSQAPSSACGSQREGVGVSRSAASVSEQGTAAEPKAVSRKVSPKRKLKADRVAGRTYVIIGGNAAPVVDRLLVCTALCASLSSVDRLLSEKGWTRLEDKTSTVFTLKWVELKQHIDYKTFKEGEQLVNHFPNINLLTTKIGLLESLRAAERTALRQRTGGLHSFFPLTYRMDVPTEKEDFLRNYKEGELWICKPTGANQGKGIFIVRELQQLLDKLEADQRNCKIATRPTARIVQRYISNPLLLEGRKFDLRVYLLIIAARPWLVLYRGGYVRLCCMPYDPDSPDPSIHLTNQYQQKKHPLYAEMKEETVWDFNRLQYYLSQEYHLPLDWVSTTLTRKMKGIVLTCFNSIQHKLENRVGYFELLGFDFMLDAEFNVWLIEVNINPAMHTNCDTLSVIVPVVLQETLDLAIEVFDKCRRSKPIMPLNSLSDFVPLVT